MLSLLDIIRDAEKRKTAIGHFNFSNIEQFRAIVDTAVRLKMPVVLGVSEGERAFIGIDQAVALVRSAREAHKHPIFLNADHTYSIEKVEEAVRAGCDAVIFDGAKLSYEDNIAGTKIAVRAAKRINRKVVVEGELGYIGQSSEIHKEIPAGAAIAEADLTTPEQALGFVRQTGIDLFAPAVGNIHGIVDAPGASERLDFQRIRAIRAAVKTPLVLHGASGLGESDLKEAVRAGISLVHISTELRVAWRDAIVGALEKNPDVVAPYKLGAEAVAAVARVVEQKLNAVS